MKIKYRFTDDRGEVFIVVRDMERICIYSVETFMDMTGSTIEDIMNITTEVKEVV